MEEEKKSSSSASLNEEERKEIAQYQELQESLKTLKDQVGQPSVKLRTKSPSSDNSKKSGKALGQNYSVSSEEDKNYDDGQMSGPEAKFQASPTDERGQAKHTKRAYPAGGAQEEEKLELNDSIEDIKDAKTMPRLEGVRKLAQMQEERKAHEKSPNAPAEKHSLRPTPNASEIAEEKKTQFNFNQLAKDCEDTKEQDTVPRKEVFEYGQQRSQGLGEPAPAEQPKEKRLILLDKRKQQLNFKKLVSNPRLSAPDSGTILKIQPKLGTVTPATPASQSAQKSEVAEEKKQETK